MLGNPIPAYSSSFPMQTAWFVVKIAEWDSTTMDWKVPDTNLTVFHQLLVPNLVTRFSLTLISNKIKHRDQHRMSEIASSSVAESSSWRSQID